LYRELSHLANPQEQSSFNIKQTDMNKFFAMALLVSTLGFLASCGGDDNGGKSDGIVISSNITANTTWTTGNTYILAGRITVVDGVTLTIQPGVIVKGQAGTGVNATALLIARGAKLNAQGSPSQPIIFTSVADEIEPGMIASPNLDPEFDGLWGGLIILGKAPISAPSDATTFQIEGIPPSDTNGLYGGDVSDDDSGTIRYISIRHGGANIGDGNEINGLTLGGVGSGTTIEYVEVIANQDDGIEWFGGSVNVSNALVWNAGDDGMDTDQAWSGTLNNFIVIGGPATDHTLELDGPEGTLVGKHTLQNGSIKGSSVAEMADLRSSARVQLSNLYFFGFPNPATSSGRGDFTITNCADCTFSNLEMVLPSGVVNVSDLLVNTITALTDATTAVTLGNNTVGATLSAFSNWTWADEDGQLDDF
jgi:hypothetical protein